MDFYNFNLLMVVGIRVTREEDQETGTNIGYTVLHYLFTVRELT